MAAEIVGGAFLSSFLSVLFDRLASQKVIDFFKGRELNSELLDDLKIWMISVEGVLDDAEEQQITRPAVRKWLAKVKDAFYEADDLADEIAYAALSSEMETGTQTSISAVSNFFSSQGRLEKVESKLEKIHAKLQRLVEEKSALELKVKIGEKLSSQKLQTSSVMDESEVVYGRQKDKEVIIQLLLSEDANWNSLGLIPIVGMGGMGKTTLAQSVYNDSGVNERFKTKAWIYVSEEFDVLKITRNILNGVSTTMPNFNTLDQFQVALKNELTNKKFLLVLDDVWNFDDEQWNILLRPLKFGAKGSKIIITTRVQNVTLLKEVIQTHHLKKLSNKECWLLFSTHAFDGRSPSEDPKLEEIGGEIAEKCDGLPLVAKSLGGLLRRFGRDHEKWERVLKNGIWSLKEDKIIPALILSYLFLPSPLKQCFAYCAIFPKGRYFKKEELVLLWMGEGFLGQASSMDREVIGEEYFDDLVSRCFFNPKEDYFIMHDLINDLAKYVAGQFCFTLDNDDDSCKVLSMTRHLRYARTKNLPSNSSEVITASPLRTFLFHAWVDHDKKVTSDVIPKLEHLRVLSFDGYFGKLKLDDSINNLKYLQTLGSLRNIDQSFT